MDAASATTTTQLASLARRRAMLSKDVQCFQQVQLSYMPGLRRFQREFQSPPSADQSNSPPELIPLYLPSSIPAENRQAICVGSVYSIEEQLREAQCSEALAELRTQLIKRTYTNKYKEQTASSQRAYTGFRTLQNHTELKIKSCQTLYNATRIALLALRGSGEWEQKYRFEA